MRWVILVYSHVEEEEAGKAVACHGKVGLSDKPVAGAGSRSNMAEPGMRRDGHGGSKRTTTQL